jgi:transposase
MRGDDRQQSGMFSYISPEDRVPKDHPLRKIRSLVEPILRDMSPRFDAIYSRDGRPSIPPEMLLRALLLQVFYSIRSERQLMEQLDYNILFRWFVGLNLDDSVWDPSTFSKNRDRLLAGEVAQAFLQGVLGLAEERRLLSHEHFTVDGTLLEAWASQKSFVPRAEVEKSPTGGDEDDPSNPTVNFRGEKRSNRTHVSRTDPEARLARKSKGTESRLCYLGNALFDNRHSLVVATAVTQPGYHAEGDAAFEMLTRLDPKSRRRTLGADKGYDRGTFVKDLRALGFTPHVAPNLHARRFKSDVDGRTTRHPGYEISQRKRKQGEEYFGWGKLYGLLHQLRHRGAATVDWIFTFTAAAYDLVRIRNLIKAGVCA